jgi:isoleucyl-tRNA synthetase
VLNLFDRAGITIVAKDRIGALESVIGAFESVAEIKGSDLVDATYVSPFSAGVTFKVIPSSHVTTESGTGLVHCAPAHGMEDYIAFQAHGLVVSDMLCHVDGQGKFTADIASVTGEIDAQSLVGQDILKGGSKAMIKILESSGSLVKMQKIKHKYPYDWKTGEPVIVVYVFYFSFYVN